MTGAANEPFLFHLVFSEMILGSAAYVIFCEDMWASANKVVFLLWLAVCLLFPFRLTVMLFGLGMYGNSLLRKANLYKISKNHMPITALDIVITLGNPAVLCFLLDYSRKWLVPFILGLAAIGAGIIFAIVKYLSVQSQMAFLHLMIVSFSFIVMFLYFKKRLFVDVSNHFSQQFPFGADVHNHMGWTLGNWEFDSISTLSQQLGMPAFILYTHILAKQDLPEFLNKTKVQPPIPVHDLVRAAKRYIPSLPAQSRDNPYPNIVAMQCESIFDPAQAFVLSNNYNSSLFARNKYTKCLCPLRVNVIGGGSWVSEFEFLTGLDTRLFGYIGYYTHVTLAPYIIGAFPAFLGALGYVTTAFYPATGKFYNAEKAYHRYGFNDFLDSRALDLPDEWTSSDFDMANAFVQRTQAFKAEPFFSFIVTNGAHSPYSPDKFLHPIQWSTAFLSDCDPIMNAQLNEYIRRLGQTEEAMQLILERLIQIENSTGRPFVFLMYGDHQPYSFTGAWDKAYNYDAVRSAAPKNQTFVHVMSSIGSLAIDFKDEMPLTLLSSIVSASVAGHHKDLYALPNFYLYEKNGSDFFPGLSAPSQFGVKQKKDITTNYFAIERAQAIAALKRLNIMRPV